MSTSPSGETSSSSSTPLSRSRRKLPAALIASSKTSRETAVTSPAAHNNWPTEAKKLREAGEAARKPKPRISAKSELFRNGPTYWGKPRLNNIAPPAKVPKHKSRKTERMNVPSNERTHRLLHADANSPAASAQQIALKLSATDNSAWIQFTPPSRNGMVSTGRTASQSV